MRLLLLLPLLALGASATAQPFSPDDRSAVPGVAGMPMCQDSGITRVDETGGAAMRKLGELPPANHILTVLRTENGCIKPVIVRQGIGAPRD